ncbi:MAG: hypothetical protein ACI8S6_001216 [Myxococcota bacterium]|jgi:hypothetical protein
MGCGRPEPRLVLPLPDDDDAVNDTGADIEDTGTPVMQPPYLVELMQDGGFEGGGFGAWIPAGCMITDSVDRRFSGSI